MHSAPKLAGVIFAGVLAVAGLLSIDAPAAARIDVRSAAVARTTAPAESLAVPGWLFVLPTAASDQIWDSITPRRIPVSRRTFTDRQLHNLYSAPDWTPGTHARMPAVVSAGRSPDVYACGYCHMPDGAGRPENVMLAGLSSGYIARQMADMKSGERRSVGPEAWVPSTSMRWLAGNTTDAEVAAAAAYFAAQKPRQRTRIVEAHTIPTVQPVMGLFRYSQRRGREPLAGRVVEVAVDHQRHERRDPNVGYIAYVPVGSVARGRSLATTPVAPGVLACTGCHGPQLRGAGDLIPPIAGRSPAYLIRQLLGFQHGTRASAAGAVMKPVANAMSLDDMIAVAAYAATLAP